MSKYKQHYDKYNEQNLIHCDSFDLINFNDVLDRIHNHQVDISDNGNVNVDDNDNENNDIFEILNEINDVYDVIRSEISKSKIRGRKSKKDKGKSRDDNDNENLYNSIKNPPFNLLDYNDQNIEPYVRRLSSSDVNDISVTIPNDVQQDFKKIMIDIEFKTPLRNGLLESTQVISIDSNSLLSTLRDNIICDSDKYPLFKSNKSDCKYQSSSCFIINNIAYFDKRISDYNDYISSIEENINLKRVCDASIHETRLGDLEIITNQPNWFVHSGNCEHILIFNCVRVKLSHERNVYHSFKSSSLAKQLKWKPTCRICSNVAKLIVYNDRLNDCLSSNYCHKCYKKIFDGFKHDDEQYVYELK